MAARPVRVRSGRAGRSVPAVAIALALIAYLLLPIVHAGHHRIESSRADLHTTSTAHTGCHHHHSHEQKEPDSPSPADRDSPGHDHSSCDICQALQAARKGIDLPPPAGIVVSALSPFIVHRPEAPCSLPAPPTLPRTTRGPPALT